MDLNSSDVLKILNRNFAYPIVQTCVGYAVQMDEYDAFLYANITGAAYLNDVSFPFSPKGLMKIFYNALDYNFVTGIFDNLSIKYTPLSISMLYPFVFSNRKNVLPIEFKSERELYTKLKEIYGIISENHLIPSDFIIQRIETSKKGNGMEPFMEYLTCEYFKRHGYVVENQIPLAHSVGSPDFAGYRTKEHISFVSATNRLNMGFHVIELAMLKLFIKKRVISSLPLEVCNIVGEAKTSTEVMADQLSKYMATGFFKEGYEIHPFKRKATYDTFGLVNLDENHILRVVKPQELYIPCSAHENARNYEKWLNNYLKLYLLANMTTDQIDSFSIETRRTHINDNADLVKLVSSLSFFEIYQRVMEV